MSQFSSSGNCVTRRAVPADAATLSDLAYRSKQSNGYDDAFMQACVEELTVTPASIREHESRVAESLHILGFFVLNTQQAIAEVEGFFIEPGAQGSGIGRMLWNELVTIAVSHGCHCIELDADPYAEGFYRRMGCAFLTRVASDSIAGRTLPRLRFELTPVRTARCKG